MKKYLLFVYGSLKKGFGNHSYYLKNANYVGTFETEPNYKMFSLGYYPGVIEDGNTSIRGELYQISEEELEHIDSLEGYDRQNPDNSLYKRKVIETPHGNAYIYILNRSLGSNYKEISTGVWESELVGC